MTKRAFPKRLSALFAVLVACGTGCKKAEPSQSTGSTPAVPSAASNGVSDAKRFEMSLGSWKNRWARLAPLPGCDRVLVVGGSESCTAAAAALATLKASVSQSKPDNTLIHDAAELARVAEEANAKLREVLPEKGVKPSNVAATIPSRGDGAVPASLPFSAHVERFRFGSDGGAPITIGGVAEPYGRASRLALRYLGTLLQQGPLATRHSAWVELERLSNERPAWPELQRLLREASLTEKDPNLRAKLESRTKVIVKTTE